MTHTENKASDERHIVILLTKREMIGGVKMDLKEDLLNLFGGLLPAIEAPSGATGEATSSWSDIVPYVGSLGNVCL